MPEPVRPPTYAAARPRASARRAGPARPAGPAGPSRREVQLAGERLAAAHLEQRGLRVLTRNWRHPAGELDLVALDPHAANGPVLVFAEVKTRRSRSFAEPSAAVDHRKQAQLRRVARAYLATEGPCAAACRFDVVSVVLPAGPPGASVEHIVDAFR